MTANTPSPQSQKSRKVKALLAGGLVLGVGAAVTLAAWTDQEWTEGVFGAGSFNIQGSVDGEAFTEHASSEGAAELDFDFLMAQNMSPGDTVAAPFVLRLDSATSYDATVALNDATASGANTPNLEYGIVQVADIDACTTEATGTTIVPAGTEIGEIGAPDTFELTSGADEAPGDSVTLCFQVTAGDNLIQGEDATAHWRFVGTSTE